MNARRPIVALLERIRMRGLDADLGMFCEGWGVTAGELLGRGRHCRIVAARRAFVRELRSRGYSLNEIGWLLGRDHTTVLNLERGVGWCGVVGDSRLPTFGTGGVRAVAP